MTNLVSRDGGSPRRRMFSPAEKLELLAGYEEAILQQQGAAFLSENGMYPSQVTEWRKLRDAGVLNVVTARPLDEKLSVEQAEILHLRSQLEKSEIQRKKTEDALEIIGKLSAFFETSLSDSEDAHESK